MKWKTCSLETPVSLSWTSRGLKATSLEAKSSEFPCGGKPVPWFKYSNSMQDTSATQSYNYGGTIMVSVRLSLSYLINSYCGISCCVHQPKVFREFPIIASKAFLFLFTKVQWGYVNYKSNYFPSLFLNIISVYHS